MIPKGKNIGLDRKEQRTWIREAILKCLCDHGIETAANGILFEPAASPAVSPGITKAYYDAVRCHVEAMQAPIEMTPEGPTLVLDRDAILRRDAASAGMGLASVVSRAAEQGGGQAVAIVEEAKVTTDRLTAHVRTLGIHNLVRYIHPRVFTRAVMEDEAATLAKVKPLPNPGVENMLDICKRGKFDYFDAVDTAFGCTRQHHVGSYLYPLLQDFAVGQPRLMTFLARHMPNSHAGRVEAILRMRRHAIDRGVLGTAVADKPQALIDFYFATIPEARDLLDSLPPSDALRAFVAQMIVEGKDVEEIREMLHALSAEKPRERPSQSIPSSASQSIPPSTKEFEGLEFTIAEKNDPICLTVGDINDSCMTWGGIADECVKDVLFNARAALLVMRRHDVPLQPKAQEDRGEALLAALKSPGRSRDLSARGYVGYCYIRHGLSGRIYIDNVEARDDAPASLQRGLCQWIVATMEEIGAPAALVGKSYSRNILGGLGLAEEMISEDELLADMPPGSGEYTDLCREGAWRLTRDASTKSSPRA